MLCSLAICARRLSGTKIDKPKGRWPAVGCWLICSFGQWGAPHWGTIITAVACSQIKLTVSHIHFRVFISVIFFLNEILKWHGPIPTRSVKQGLSNDLWLVNTAIPWFVIVNDGQLPSSNGFTVSSLVCSPRYATTSLRACYENRTVFSLFQSWEEWLIYPSSNFRFTVDQIIGLWVTHLSPNGLVSCRHDPIVLSCDSPGRKEAV